MRAYLQSGIVAVLLTGSLLACHRQLPSAEKFQFPMAVYLQSQPSDFWEEFEKGLRSRLDLPEIEVEVFHFTPEEREAVASQILQEPRWTVIAICTVPDEWAIKTIDRSMLAGIPVIVVGVDISKTARSGYVGTHYYDVGYRAGKWYARCIPRGRVMVIGNHPVPGATSELWEGFRHGLLFNKRVSAQLITTWDTEKLRLALERAKIDPTIKGVFAFGSDAPALAIEVGSLPNLGVMGWRAENRRWFGAGQCDLAVVEKPESMGMSVGNLMRNLSAGRGDDFRGVFTPVEWLAR